MKQSIFYRCMRNGDKVFALRTIGYTEGGIGLFKEPNGWVATHIPTGGRATTHYNTARQALREAEDRIAKSEDILATVQQAMSMDGYNDFLIDRHKQQLEDNEKGAI